MARTRQNPNSCGKQGVGQQALIIGPRQVSPRYHSNYPDSPYPWGAFLEKHVWRKWGGCQTSSNSPFTYRWTPVMVMSKAKTQLRCDLSTLCLPSTRITKPNWTHFRCLLPAAGKVQSPLYFKSLCLCLCKLTFHHLLSNCKFILTFLLPNQILKAQQQFFLILEIYVFVEQGTKALHISVIF